jgi:IS605 OrfB family transposase
LRIDDRIHQYSFDHYSIAISLKDGKVRIYVTIPYKPEKYLEQPHIASFDLNSDRINMVIVDNQGIIRDVRSIHFHQVNSPGYPKDKAKYIRLNALARLLDYAKEHNCGTVLFEKLRMKKKKKKRSRKGNRKSTKFACRQMLSYGVNMALRRGLKIYMVNPSYTSRIAKKICKELGLDKHTVSAYLLALKYLNKEAFENLKESL